MPRNATEEARDDGQMTGGIIEIDVHGKNIEEAKKAIDIQIHTAGKSIYRLRVIHGYNGGTRIRSMLREDYRAGAQGILIIMRNKGFTDEIEELKHGRHGMALQ